MRQPVAGLSEQTVMNITTCPELNGARLYVPGEPPLWLIFHGLRHHIVGAAIYEALFDGWSGLSPVGSVAHIQRGPDLNDGTCLARAIGEDDIFLVTGHPETETRKYRVSSYEDFLTFGFSESKINNVPRLLLDAIMTGPEISASD